MFESAITEMQRGKTICFNNSSDVIRILSHLISTYPSFTMSMTLQNYQLFFRHYLNPVTISIVDTLICDRERIYIKLKETPDGRCSVLYSFENSGEYITFTKIKNNPLFTY